MSGSGAGHRRAAWAAILLAAMLVRLVFAGAVVGFDTAPKADEADYHAIALNLTEGDGFASFDGKPTARRPPGYPLFLAGLYSLTGESPRTARVAQVIFGVVVVGLTGLLARRYFGSTVALYAAALAAVNPFLVFMSGYLLTENLYLVFLLSALVVARSPRELCASRRRALLTGALLGLATLVRPTGLPMFEWILVALVLFAGVAWRARAVHAAIVAAAFALVVFPWYARNAKVVGGWVLTTHGGITFLQGNNEKVASVPQWRGGVAPLEALPLFQELSRQDELTRDRMAWDMGRDYLRSNWRDVPRVVFWKMVRFWRVQSDMGLSGIRSGWWFNKNSALGRFAANVDVGFVYAIVVIPLFVAGLILTRSRARELLFVYGVIAVHTAVAAVFFGSLRTRIPIEPVMCVLAALAGIALWRRLSQHFTRGASRAT